MQSFTFELPMKKYLVERFMKNNFKNRTHIIFDQLNPEYAKFYKKEKYVNLLKKMVSLLSKLTIVLEIIGLLEQLKNNFKFYFLISINIKLNEPAPQNLYSRNIRCLLISLNCLKA